MTYFDLLAEIKKIFIKRLDSIIPGIAYLANPDIPDFIYQEMVYNDIMALGYNLNDKKKAAYDIYEAKSNMHGESTMLLNSVKKGIEDSANHYPMEIHVFSQFHKLSQGCSKSDEDYKQIIKIIQSRIDNID